MGKKPKILYFLLLIPMLNSCNLAKYSPEQFKKLSEQWFSTLNSQLFPNSAGNDAAANLGDGRNMEPIGTRIYPDQSTAALLLAFDDGDYASAASPLSLSWSPASGKNLDAFTLQFALGSTPGREDIQDWKTLSSKDSGFTLNLASLKLTAQQHYYSKLQLLDPQGHSLGILVSNGFDFLAPLEALSIAPSSGKAASNSRVVSLTLAANQAVAMYLSSTGSCLSGGSWEPYATSKASRYLSAANQVNTVAVRFRNQAGELSACLTSSIRHDSSPPTAPSNFVSSDGASPSFTWSAANDEGSGIASYEISVGTSAGNTNVMNWSSFAPATAKSFASLPLALGVSYFANIRANDVAGNYSAVVSSPAFVKRVGQQAYIKAINNDPNDTFGQSVAISADTMAVGAEGEESKQTTISNNPTASSDNSNPLSGAVYIYQRVGEIWAQQSFIKAANSDAGDLFGHKAAIDQNTVVVGAPLEDSNQNTISNGTTASSDNSSGQAGAAYVYIRNGTTWSQQAYLKAANSEANDRYGSCVAINGDTIAVSAPREDSSQSTISNGPGASANNSSSDSGAVYVYQRSGSSWIQQAYIKPATVKAGAYFGSSLSLSNDTLAVGAENSDSGSVFIFKRSGSTWAQEASISPANASSGEAFGHNLSLQGDSLAVGAYREDSAQSTVTNGTSASADTSLSDSGAVYIYTRSGTSWSQQAYIKAPNAASGDWFGYDLNLYGDLVAIGSPHESSKQNTSSVGVGGSSDTSSAASGAVYLFKRSGSSWSQHSYLKAANNAPGANFGGSISLYDKTVAIGAPQESSDQIFISSGESASSSTGSASSGASYIYLWQ